MPEQLTIGLALNASDNPNEFLIDLNNASMRWIGDHRVQDMRVVPGALYVASALKAYRSQSNAGLSLQGIDFEHVLIFGDLNDRKNWLKVTSHQSDSGASLACYSATYDGGQTRHASLNVVEKPGDPPLLVDVDRKDREGFSKEIIYERLARNGNQYGPTFQCIESVAVSQNDCLATIKPPPETSDESIKQDLHPIVLDACAQCLAVIKLDLGKTFLLEGIDQIDIYDLPVGRFQILAHLTNEQKGQVDVIDDVGTCLIRLSGVRFRHLDRAKTAMDDVRNNAETIAISSTFTVEPLEDTLLFWRKKLGVDIVPGFAPFNQIFQELLDPQSFFATNDAGANAIVLRLEDWTQNVAQKHGANGAEIRSPKEVVGASEVYTLPNQLKIAHINQYETDYLFKEIFIDRCYIRHGISLDDAECVIDIGANIGMFTMFVQQQCPKARVFSFEPGPKVFQALEANSHLINDLAKVHNSGVSEKSGEATFTYYDKSTVFSTFSADQTDDQAAIRAVIENAVQNKEPDDQVEVDGIVDGLIGERLEAKTMTCPLVSLSDVIRDNGIERIDLLKVDAEKSELAILRGIEDADWPKIRQIVIEVHDKIGNVIEAVVTLLKDRGFVFEMTEEDLLRNSGLYNIYATRKAKEASPPIEMELTGRDRQLIEQTAEDFVAATRSFAARSKRPTIIAFSAPSIRLAENTATAKYLAGIESDIIDRLAGSSGIYTLSSAQIKTHYPVVDYFDAVGDQAGKVPYTSAYYSALATALFRQYHATRRPPFKVIVLDCDNTLWKGVCGEVGPNGIELDPPRLALQAFVKKKIDEGMVVCLCSKNVQEDVQAVFDARDDMILSMNDIVASRINWQPKSANLIALAEELNLGLDSFVMIDDSAVECAEIKANCPAVLTLQLPIDAADTIPRFLDHVWAFDQVSVTEEGRKRTRLYKENTAREGLRANTISLSDFIARLDLNIQIKPMRPENIERVADLTRRTNQFNVSTIRRNAGEIKELTDSGHLECVVVTVRDRFGDYGLVGVMMIELADNRLIVDTMLLSCRVLGRGVEHKMLAFVGQQAVDRRLSQVDVPYRATAKSVPAGQFLDVVGADYRKAEEASNAVYQFPADRLAALTFKPEDAQEPADSQKRESATQTTKRSGDRLYEFSEEIARELWDVEKLVELSKEVSAPQPRPDLTTLYRAPKTDLERKIASAWAEILGLDKVGIQDNFFELGGTSLKAVQLIAHLNRELSLQVPIVTLFAEPTITALTRSTDRKPANDTMPRETSSQQRGAARRKTPMRRRRG